MDDLITRFVREINIHTDEKIGIVFSLLLLSGIIIFSYWFYVRRKMHSLTHQIPASVLKNYLDSIIQNSTALKSSLFRGGGLEVADGIPSVLPTSQFAAGDSIGLSGDSSEEIGRKQAEISSLNRSLQDKNLVIRDLEKKVAEVSSQLSSSGGAGGADPAVVAALEKEIVDLKTQLAKAQNSSGGGGNEAELKAVTTERDELKERLMEYEIIEEDLANLKRLQQENEQLLNKVKELEGGSAAAPAPAAVVEPEPTPEPAPAAEIAAEIAAEAPVEDEEDLEAAMAAAIDAPDEPQAAAATDAVPENEGEQKSAEELLQEFERMLD